MKTKKYVSLSEVMLPIEGLEELGDELFAIKGGAIPVSGAGCGCSCSNGVGCGCGCGCSGTGNGCGCGCGCS